MSEDACPAFAQELLLNWGSCPWCFAELYGRFSCSFFSAFLTPTHQPSFPSLSWDLPCPSRPVLAAWVSGHPNHLHPPSSAHLALLLWALSRDGVASLFLLLPASPLETEAVVDFYRIIFVRWMLVNILQVHPGHMFMTKRSELSVLTYNTV